MLAQIATDAKSNEITAVPKLLRMLSLKGTIARRAELSVSGLFGDARHKKGPFGAIGTLLRLWQKPSDMRAGCQRTGSGSV